MQVEQHEEGFDPPVETQEWWASGVYAREMRMLKDRMIVGRTHKYETVNTLSKGTALVATVDGIEEYSAPYTFVSRAGTKRVIFAVTALVWTTYHAHDRFDVEEIQNKYTAD